MFLCVVKIRVLTRCAEFQGCERVCACASPQTSAYLGPDVSKQRRRWWRARQC